MYVCYGEVLVCTYHFSFSFLISYHLVGWDSKLGLGLTLTNPNSPQLQGHASAINQLPCSTHNCEIPYSLQTLDNNNKNNNDGIVCSFQQQ